MNRQDIVKAAAEFYNRSSLNYMKREEASSKFIGLKIFDAPLIAFGSADDPLFSEFKKPEIVGDIFMTPEEWLPGAKTVVSFFLPFTETIRKSNSIDMTRPSDEWSFGRVKGEVFLNALSDYMRGFLQSAGYRTVAPGIDKRFKSVPGEFKSNWSERHAAFVCGLGTFGLSKGLITEKGVAGRLCSIITALKIEADSRKYNGIYENCTNCGACAGNCPAEAISVKAGKDHVKCSAFLDTVKAKCLNGCGKCQVAVPCENGIPQRI